MRSQHLSKVVKTTTSSTASLKKHLISHVSLIQAAILNDGVVVKLVTESIKMIPECAGKATLKVA